MPEPLMPEPLSPSTPRSLRWFRTWFFIGMAGLVADAWLTLAPPGGGEALLPDKLAHFLVYFCLACWFSGLFPGRRLVVFLALSAFGGVLEIIQPVSGRSMELLDGLANAAGALVGMLLIRSLPVNLFAWLESRLNPTQ